MKTILLLLFILNLLLFSQWKEIERPETVSSLKNLNSGSDFIVGNLSKPYFSFDNGKTWEERANGLPEEYGGIYKIEVDNDVVFLYTLTSFYNEEAIFYYTTNHGLNWKKVGENQNYSSSNIMNDFVVKNGRINSIHYGVKGIITSENYGESWDTLPQWNNNITSMHLIDYNHDTIIIADRGLNRNNCSGIMLSLNGGISWEQINNGLEICGITCIKLIGNNIYVGKDNGFYFSDDLGKNWKKAGSLVFNSYINDIEIINDTLYLATNDGLFKSIDIWKEWEEISFFKQKRVKEILFNNRFYITSQNFDYLKNYTYSSNNLENFEIQNLYVKSILDDIFIEYPNIYFSTSNLSSNFIYKKEGLKSNYNKIFFDSIDFYFKNLSKIDDVIVSRLTKPTRSSENNKYIISTDNGITWNFHQIPIELNSLVNITQLNKDSLFIISQNGVYLSSNLGIKWAQYEHSDSLINEGLTKVSKSKKNKDKIYFYGGGRILETDKNLSNWESLIRENSNSLYLFTKNILEFSKDKNNIFIILHQGGFVEPTSIDFMHSKDNGVTWQNIKSKFSEYPNFRPINVFNENDYVFLSSTSGLFFSKDNGEIWYKIDEGISNNAKSTGGKFEIYDDKIVYCSPLGIFYRDLEELGIVLSVQKTETRNYLWINPPYPQPTNSIVKVETYWDSGLPFSEKDIEIYDITGIKINTENTLSIQKERIYKGHIIWDASSNKTGIYIMKITHGTETRVRKIMVVE